MVDPRTLTELTRPATEAFRLASEALFKRADCAGLRPWKACARAGRADATVAAAATGALAMEAVTAAILTAARSTSNKPGMRASQPLYPMSLPDQPSRGSINTLSDTISIDPDSMQGWRAKGRPKLAARRCRPCSRSPRQMRCQSADGHLMPCYRQMPGIKARQI